MGEEERESRQVKEEGDEDEPERKMRGGGRRGGVRGHSVRRSNQSVVGTHLA